MSLRERRNVNRNVNRNCPTLSQTRNYCPIQSFAVKRRELGCLKECFSTHTATRGWAVRSDFTEPARRPGTGRVAACEERRIGNCKIGDGQGAAGN